METVRRFLASLSWHYATKRTRLLYGWRLGNLGHGAIIERGVELVGLKRIHVGKSTRICRGARIAAVGDGDESIVIGECVHVWPNVLLDCGRGEIKIGSNVSIGSYTEVYGHGGCEIGDDSQIAGHCYIIPANHRYDDPNVPVREQGMICKGIKIGPDCWLGHGVSVLDGVTMGRGCVVAARAVVTKDVPDLAVVVGIPARVVGHRGSKQP